MGIETNKATTARDSFGKDVADQLSSHDNITRAVYEPTHFQVIFDLVNGETGFIRLENSFRECEGASPSARHAVIAKITAIAAWRQEPHAWDELRARLRPVLRPTGFEIKHANTLLRRPAMPYLTEFVVVDSPRAMRYVTTEDLASWGKAPDELFAAAHANLADAAARAIDGATPGPGLIQLTDDYSDSLPLIDGWLAAMGAKFGERPLAFITRPGNLLVGTVPPPQTLSALLSAAAEDYREGGGRAITPVGYTADEEGRVVPYDVPTDTPCSAAIRSSQMMLAVDTYAKQTEHLRAIYEHEGNDIYVGTVMHMASPKGNEFTVTTWTAGCVAHLPQAHYVGFVNLGDGDGESPSRNFVPWKAVADAGVLRPVEDLDPPRYLVEDWPDPSIMERLLAQSELP